MRAAYLRDGRAYVRWISWLEGKIMKEKRDVGEWAAAMALGRFRRSEENFACVFPPPAADGRDQRQADVQRACLRGYLGFWAERR